MSKMEVKRVVRINTNDNISDMKGGGNFSGGFLFILIFLIIIIFYCT